MCAKVVQGQGEKNIIIIGEKALYNAQSIMHNGADAWTCFSDDKVQLISRERKAACG